MYYIVLGFLVTCIVALTVSAFTHGSDCVDPDLFTPFVAKRLKKRELLKNKMVSIKINLFSCSFVNFNL